MISLHFLNDDKFNIFVDSRYSGQLIKGKYFWDYVPEQNIGDMDRKILLRLDRILRILNN